MSTNDVPGANKANFDKLSRGCWAEHADGSLIYVKDIDENDRVIFEILDLKASVAPVHYSHAMALKEFEKQFSFDPKNPKGLKWTWHDKTPFPWEKVMKVVSSPVPSMSADDTLSAAAKIAESLRARMQDLDEDALEEMSGVSTDRPKASAKSVFERIKNAIHEMTA